MDSFVLILSFVLSCFFSGGRVAANVAPNAGSSSIVKTSEQQQDHSPDYNTLAILPAQSARVSGESQGFSPSARRVNSGRRTQVSLKFPFRVVKAGKVTDRNNYYDFQAELMQFQSGIHSVNRYIHTVCQLLI